MSHFTVTVILDGTTPPDQLHPAVTAALAPFDENIEVDRYVQHTKQELIANARKEIEEYRDTTYAEFLADRDAYIAAHSNNPRHIEYLFGGTAVTPNLPALTGSLRELARRVGEEWKWKPMPYEESFPAKLEWTDEQVYQHELRFYEPDNFNSVGDLMSTRNPLSKWDWWAIGGRWGGKWEVYPSVDTAPLKWLTEASTFGMAPEVPNPLRVDVARKCDIVPETLKPTFALLTQEGEWIERGRMGWFGTAFDEEDADAWAACYADVLARESDNAWLVNVDCHI